MRLTPYDASGGASMLRSYEQGEGTTIESQKGGSYVVAWSAHVPASAFLETIASWVDPSAETELTPAANGRPTIPFKEAMEIVEAQPSRFRFIAIDDADEHFTWQAANPDGETGDYPEVPGEVGIVFSDLNTTWIRQLIEATATPLVRLDLKGILESAESLTGSTPSAAA
jgi:hypothetical protein